MDLEKQKGRLGQSTYTGSRSSYSEIDIQPFISVHYRMLVWHWLIAKVENAADNESRMRNSAILNILQSFVENLRYSVSYKNFAPQLCQQSIMQNAR
jgi:hypothetical protein